MDVKKMTNNEFRMTKEIRSTNDEGRQNRAQTASSFGLGHSFGFRHSSFVIFPVTGHWSLVIDHLPTLAVALLLAGCITENSIDNSATPTLSYPTTRTTN